METIERLDATIRAVCPIDGVSLTGQAATIQFAEGATEQQKTDAYAALAAFDWSPAAAAAAETAHAKSKAQAFYDAAQVAGADVTGRVVIALALVVMDEINILRTAASLPPRTVNQLVNAIKNKVNAGA